MGRYEITVDREKGKPLVHLLVCLFGITSWSIMNGLWVELPILVSHLPEGWTLPSYLTIIAQFGNLGPLIFIFFIWLFPRTKLETPTSMLVVSVLSLCALFYAFFWEETTQVAGQNFSIVLLTLTFCQSIFSATSSMSYLAFMAHLKIRYMSSLFIGMSFSGLIPAFIAIGQGTSDIRCVAHTTNITAQMENTSFVDTMGNGTLNFINASIINTNNNNNQNNSSSSSSLVQINSDPNFSVESFFLLLFGVGMVSLVSLVILVYHPYCRTEHVDTETEENCQLMQAIASQEKNNMTSSDPATPVIPAQAASCAQSTVMSTHLQLGFVDLSGADTHSTDPSPNDDCDRHDDDNDTRLHIDNHTRLHTYDGTRVHMDHVDSDDSKDRDNSYGSLEDTHPTVNNETCDLSTSPNANTTVAASLNLRTNTETNIGIGMRFRRWVARTRRKEEEEEEGGGEGGEGEKNEVENNGNKANGVEHSKDVIDDVDEGKQLSKMESWYLLALLVWINALQTSYVLAIQVYSSLPYGLGIYDGVTKTENIVDPIACIITLFVTAKTTRIISGVTLLGTLFSVYIIAMAAMSPLPFLVDDTIGGILIIAAWVMCTLFMVFAKVSIATVMRSQGRKSLMFTGASTQIGSMIGAILAYCMINQLNLFRDQPWC